MATPSWGSARPASSVMRTSEPRSGIPWRARIADLSSALLPGGRWLLLRTGVPGVDPEEGPSVVVLDLESGERRVLIKGGTSARYLPTGHIAYVVGGFCSLSLSIWSRCE